MALWHVTLTLGGAELASDDVLAALHRLADERPFLLSGRYARNRAEVRYWEEAADCQDAAALALRLWYEHRASADLPPWQVIGLEVVEEAVHQARGTGNGISAVGAWHPF